MTRSLAELPGVTSGTIPGWLTARRAHIETAARCALDTVIAATKGPDDIAGDQAVLRAAVDRLHNRGRRLALDVATRHYRGGMGADTLVGSLNVLAPSGESWAAQILASGYREEAAAIRKLSRSPQAATTVRSPAGIPVIETLEGARP